jgi:hypothetical protein
MAQIVTYVLLLAERTTSGIAAADFFVSLSFIAMT